MQESVGIMEVSGFNRFEIAGEGSAEFLDRMVCGNMPTVIGHVRLCYLLNEHGHVLGEATIAKLDENRYWYGSAAASEWHDLDWLNQFKPESVRITEMVASHTILVVAGPQSRALLQSLSPRTDFSKKAFPWMRARTVMLGHAQMVAMSVSFSGELAYELHIPNEQLYLAWTLLQEAGKAFDLSMFGLYATESMRMEKSYRHWKADLLYERNPMESGLDRFVNMDKPDFIGKEALQKEIARGPLKLFVTLVVECDIAAAHVGDPIYLGDQLVGSVTSGAYGHRLQKNIAMGFVAPEQAATGTKLTIEILGERREAEVVEGCLYDPTNLLVKS
jgi:dimethylglycine dehydrogenase